KPGRPRGESDVAFLEIHPLFSEGEEEIPAGVRIDDGMKADLRFVHLQGRKGADGVSAACADEITDYTDIRVQGLGRSTGSAVHRQLAGGREGRARRYLRGPR